MDAKSDVLLAAAKTAKRLEDQGVQIFGHYSNGRQAVLIIDKPPLFVRGGLRRRQPDGRGGTEYVMAAPYEGLQIEWTNRVAYALEVGDGSRR